MWICENLINFNQCRIFLYKSSDNKYILGFYYITHPNLGKNDIHTYKEEITKNIYNHIINKY